MEVAGFVSAQINCGSGSRRLKDIRIRLRNTARKCRKVFNFFFWRERSDVNPSLILNEMNVVLWEYCAVKSKTLKTLALFTWCCVCVSWNQSWIQRCKAKFFQIMFQCVFCVCEKVRIWILVLRIIDCEKIPIASITTSRLILPDEILPNG